MGTYLDCGCYISDNGERTWCPSCLDVGYAGTKATPETEIAHLRRQLTEARAEIERLRKVHKEIAKQKLESEVPEEDRDDGDYRGAYDCIVRVARAALRREE